MSIKHYFGIALLICFSALAIIGCKMKPKKSDYFEVKKLPQPVPLDESEIEFDARAFVRDAMKNNAGTRNVEMENMDDNTRDVVISEFNIHNPRVWAWQTRMRYVKKNNKWYLDWAGTRWKCVADKNEDWHTKKCG